MRVVLDTNILARSAYSLTGPAAEVLDRLSKPGHTLIASPFLLDELRRVLRYPRLQRLHGLIDMEINRFVADVAAVCLLVEPASTVAEGVVASDPDDNPIVAAAIIGQAEVLCTLDKHLHQLQVVEYRTKHGIRVMHDVSLLSLLRAVEKRSPGVGFSK